MTTQPRSIRAKVLGVLLVLVACLGLLAETLHAAARNRLFFDGYESLALGMSRAEVDRLLLAPAAYICKYRSDRVHYYFREEGMVFGVLSGGLPKELPGEVTDISRLPNLYAAVQVAFSSDDRVLAFTWIGETFNVVAADGTKVPGTNIGLLDAELRPRQSGVRP